MTTPDIAYEFYMNDTKITGNSCKASFVSPYNVLTVKFKPTNVSLSYWEARVTPDATHSIDEYDIEVGVLAAWGSNIPTTSQTTKNININSTNFCKGDGVYRIGLYGKSAVDGSWDVTYLFFTVDNMQFIPLEKDGLEVLTDRQAPQNN